MNTDKPSTLQVIMDEQGCWEDLREKGFSRGELKAIAALSHGTVGGKPTVALRVELNDDGAVVLAEIPMRLFISAAEALLGRYAQELYDADEQGPPTSPSRPKKN